MPKAAPTPCGQPGCGELSHTHDGRCKAHGGGKSNWYKRPASATGQPAYGYKWRKQRVRILQRDKYLCQEHKRQGKIAPATEVDHIIARAHGGTEDDSNLQSLCSPCHRAKTAREGRR